MRMTNESDYALRIAGELTRGAGVVSARELSERSDVTLRFTLKILRKLSLAGITESRKGAQGGYRLKKPPEEISLGEIIEAVEGQISTSRCSLAGYTCPRATGETDCRFRRYFCGLTERLREELYRTKLSALPEEPGADSGRA